MVTWFLAQVRPNHDQIAQRNLERQGICTLCPLELRTFVRRSHFVHQQRSFFPGYIFCGISDHAISCSEINSTYGVSQLVRFGQKPAVVPPHIIEQIKRSCNADGVVQMHQDLQQGDKVAVTCGTFTNFMGRIARLAPNDRALVLLDLMGSEVSVDLPREHLRGLAHPVAAQKVL